MIIALGVGAVRRCRQLLHGRGPNGATIDLPNTAAIAQPVLLANHDRIHVGPKPSTGAR
jgi:hypothetical protein